MHNNLRRRTFLALSSVAIASSARLALADDSEDALRKAVLAATKSDEASLAYQKYFEHIGKSGLKKLIDDKDTSIALQAAWEFHKKPIKLDKPRDGNDDFYDPKELERFCDFLKDRTGANPAQWWLDSLTDVAYFSGKHHGFTDAFRASLKQPEQAAESGELERTATGHRFHSGKRYVDISFHALAGKGLQGPGSVIDIGSGPGSGSTIGQLEEKYSAIIVPQPAGGFEYPLLGFNTFAAGPNWTSLVWSAGRKVLGGNAYHRAGISFGKNTWYIFGRESHGIYLEAFDAETGKCDFRFCSCYWFNFSEAWKWAT